MSIYNRSYMQASYQPNNNSFSALKWLLLIMVGVFLLQNILRHWFGLSWMEDFFSLSLSHLGQGFIHTIFTYGLLHSTDAGLPWHLVLNGLMLYWFGKELEARIGAIRFLEVFCISVLFGGLLWSLVRVGGSGSVYAQVVGASGGVFGIMTMFCMFNWRQEMGLLWLPMRFEGRHLFYILAGFQGFFFLFNELPQIGGTTVAYSAHLGGMLGGYIFFRHLLPRPSFFQRWQNKPRATAQEPMQAKKMMAGKSGKTPRFTLNIQNRDALKEEVDRILDKINDKGFGALSPEEKATLDRAKDVLK